jgi:ferrous iron transport protein B
MTDSGWAFLRRAGTIILASMVVVWALLYFPRTEPEEKVVHLTDPETGAVEERRVSTYDEHAALLEERLGRLQEQAEAAEGAEKARLEGEAEHCEKELRRLNGKWKRQSFLGRMGRTIEPAVRPLGWDWKIGMAALASFPAREVVVGTLGIIYNLGEVDAGEIEGSDDPGATGLAQALRDAKREDGSGLPVFTVPVALSLMVFFALCAQCASTLAIIKRETNSWRWPLFTFAYMTILAYVGALVVYQVGSLF